MTMRKKQYDVVIVGCGPGGAMAGKFAALSGAETLILEDKRQIGYPNPDPMSIIYSKSELEEVTGEEIEPATIHSRAEGLSYISPGGKEREPHLLADGLFVNRPLLERSLAMGAVRAGAELVLHTRVVDVVKKDGAVKGVIAHTSSGFETISCSVVVAADGYYQYVAQRAGIKFPDAAVDMNLGCDFVGVKPLGGAHRIDEIYLDDSGEAQYRFVVPYADDRFSLGIGVGRAAVKKKKTLKQRLYDLVRHLEALKRYDFSKASPVSMIAASQAVRMGSVLAADGIILVGTATGGVIYGSRCGGNFVIPGACWTGRIAAKIAIEAVRKGDVSKSSLERPYKALIDESLKGEGPDVIEALASWQQILGLSPQKQDEVVAEIGQEVATLHFYKMGALPLRPSLEPVRKWLKESKGGES
jgi:digeranylgeranylglycerophospholipid reductase